MRRDVRRDVRRRLFAHFTEMPHHLLKITLPKERGTDGSVLQCAALGVNWWCLCMLAGSLLVVCLYFLNTESSL